MEVGVLVLKVLLFGFDLLKVVSNAFNDAILARDDPALLAYNFFRARDKFRGFF